MAPPIPAPGPARVRRATLDDVPALIRLRVLMFDAMGIELGPDWFTATETWFRAQLAVPDSTQFAAFVADDPRLGVVCCAAGLCLPHAPGPVNLGGLHGHVFNISTDQRCRRRGLARGCLTALIDWFDTGTGARVLDLNATGDGIALYRSMGFAEPRWPALQLRLP